MRVKYKSISWFFIIIPISCTAMRIIDTDEETGKVYTVKYSIHNCFMNPNLFMNACSVISFKPHKTTCRNPKIITIENRFYKLDCCPIISSEDL